MLNTPSYICKYKSMLVCIGQNHPTGKNLNCLLFSYKFNKSDITVNDVLLRVYMLKVTI